MDSVSGATVSSEGIVAAVADAIAKAGGDVEALKNVDIAAGEHSSKELTADVVVVGGGAGFAETMRKAVADSGAEVYLGTKVESLITDDNGAVVGVKAVSTDGNTDYTVSAANVILATGGYGNNKEMLTDEMKSALYYGPATSTGEGIQMAQAVGAQTANMEYGKRYPNGIEVDTGLAKSTIAGNIAGWTMSAILVNQEGNRVVNEKASNRTILETELQQTGGELFLLLDSETFEVWKSKLSEAGISESDIEKYLEANGTTTPVFAHGETLEEAAAAAGIDADALKATVERYNGFVAAGADEDFGRAEAYLTMPIGDGPYYIIEQKPRFATTMGGLVVNTSMQVLSTSGSPIAGLYAAGENCGQVMGDDSPSGANNAWAITSGKLAADAIAAK